MSFVLSMKEEEETLPSSSNGFRKIRRRIRCPLLRKCVQQCIHSMSTFSFLVSLNSFQFIVHIYFDSFFISKKERKTEKPSSMSIVCVIAPSYFTCAHRFVAVDSVMLYFSSSFRYYFGQCSVYTFCAHLSVWHTLAQWLKESYWYSKQAQLNEIFKWNEIDATEEVHSYLWVFVIAVKACCWHFMYAPVT